MYIQRQIAQIIKKNYENFPVTLITGPRQSGKTTLVRHLFPTYEYYNLEDPDLRLLAEKDPKTLLSFTGDGIIIDEVQYVPGLLSHIQVIVDSSGKTGKFILTGSQNLLLSEKIAQSLAGRVIIFELLPLSVEEIKQVDRLPSLYEELIYKGFYPVLWSKQVPAYHWYAGYVNTYIERDLRNIINVKNLTKFQDLLNLLAARTGQILNYSSLANDLSVDVKTVMNWISVLEQSYVVFRVRPYYKNFGRRIVKSPKLYFYDTGLVCYLLELDSPKYLKTFYLRGQLFENMIMAEVQKLLKNCGLKKTVFYFRDKTGNEVDALIERYNEIIAAEIKAARSLDLDNMKGLNRLAQLTDNVRKVMFYGGDKSFMSSDVSIFSWQDISKFGVEFQICPD